MNLSKKDLEKISIILGREPNLVEKYIFDTMWSEHCSYKSSKDVLKTLPTKGSDVALGVGEDSGIIRFTKHNGKQYCIAVSHESHNHPSQILPIEGAATGVGGVVRDVYCMGADVVGVLDSLHFGVDKTGKDPMVEEIAEEVVVGVSDYANPLGVPVLGGETIYHPSYNDNCLVNVGALGLVEEDKIIHSYVPKEAKDTPYDVILFGKSTDATGFGGASFASVTLDSENETSNIGAVQVHDPFLKRVMVEALKYLLKIVNQQNIKIGMKDLGAGGIACATSEIAAAGGFGVNIYLEKVNTAFPNLPSEVILCSETQERFCLVVPKDFSQTVLDIFNKEFELPKIYRNSGAVIIGEIVSEQAFNVFYQNQKICSLPVHAITTQVKENRASEAISIPKQGQDNLEVTKEQIQDICYQMLAAQNNCSKRYIYRFYDNAVRGDTILYPGEADAVVVTPIEGCKTALTVSMDSNLYGEVDPYTSGTAAVAESIRNIIAVGGFPLALTDCLNYGNPEKPPVFYGFEQGVKGIADAAQALSFKPNEAIPIISGNVSFYNESKQGKAIIPSPVIIVVGRVHDYHQTISMQITSAQQKIVLLGKRYAEFGGTQIKAHLRALNNTAPQVRFAAEHARNQAVVSLIKKDLLSACHDISIGGMWQSLVEMVLGQGALPKIGLDLMLPNTFTLLENLFSENGGYLISLKEEHWAPTKKILNEHQVAYYELGYSIPDTHINLQYKDLKMSLNLANIKEHWTIKNLK
jgi:phosphoribosylformylglycinamidine synthase